MPIFLFSWSTTAWNRWGYEMEQHHPHLGFRHRSFDDNMCPLPWESGPNKIAQELRDLGKEKTDGFY